MQYAKKEADLQGIETRLLLLTTSVKGNLNRSDSHQKA